MRAISILLVIGGCALDDPPEAPSWQVDVMPVLAANCVRCHGYPLNPLAPSDFRLDAYGETALPGASFPLKGASDSSVTIARITEPGFRSNFEDRMPPNRSLDDRSYRILRNWAGTADAVSNIAPRGPGRPDNRPPTITMSEVGRTGAVLTLAVDVDDPDRDLVSGAIFGPVLGDQMQVLTGAVGVVVSGRRTFDWDTTGLPAGTYELTAHLDDGADLDGPDGDEDYIEVPALSVVLP